MVMSVAAPETDERTEVATGGFAAAAPTGLLPSAIWPSATTTRRTSVPLAAAAGNLLVCAMFFILGSHRRTRLCPPRANARRGRAINPALEARAAQRGSPHGHVVKVSAAGRGPLRKVLYLRSGFWRDEVTVGGGARRGGLGLPLR